jgi:hypothetical protein
MVAAILKLPPDVIIVALFREQLRHLKTTYFMDYILRFSSYYRLLTKNLFYYSVSVIKVLV